MFRPELDELVILEVWLITQTGNVIVFVMVMALLKMPSDNKYKNTIIKCIMF